MLSNMADALSDDTPSYVSDAQDTVLRAGSRERQLTDKGYQYEKVIVERNFKIAVSKWRRCVNRLTILLSDAAEIDPIRVERADLETDFHDVTATFTRLSQVHKSDDPTTEEFVKVFEDLEKDHQNIMCKVSDRILEFRTFYSESQSAPSVHTKSSRTSRSSKAKASVTSKRSDAAAEVAALKAKLKFIDAESKAKVELEKVVTQRKIEVAQAKANALGETSSESLSSSEGTKDLGLPTVNKQEYVSEYLQHKVEHLHSDPGQDTHKKEIIFKVAHSPSDPGQNTNKKEVPTKVDHPPTGKNQSHGLGLNPSASGFTPSASKQNAEVQVLYPNPPVVIPSVDTGILELTKSLSEQLALSRLPPPEPGIFNGDPLKYPGWKSAFQTLIERKSIPSSEKVHYLRKYLGNEVREVVSNFFLIGTDDAYEEAKRLLDQRYGDPFVVANAFRDKLEKWPKIQSRDGYGLRRFSDFLKQCHTAMASVGSLSVLNDERENRKMLGKLPEWLLNRWNRFVVQWREERNAFPPFKEFMLFVSKEAKIACDPVTSLQALKPDYASAGKKGDGLKNDERAFKRIGSFMSNVKDESEVQTSDDKAQKQAKGECLFCQRKNHDIDSCRSFLAKSLAERKAYAKQRGLCFGCLKEDHISRTCVQRNICRICKQRHPTAFHGDLPQTQKQKGSSRNQSGSDKPPVYGNSLMSVSSSSHLSSMILPVYVSHESCPEREHLVYALLDTQSDTTFVHDGTCEALGVVGTEVNLQLSTMYAENRLVSSQKVKGLRVRGYDGSITLSLPDAYTRQIMPVNRDHIPSREMAEKWPHLGSVLDEIPPLLDCVVGLLIGYNCSRALLPRDVVAPEKDGPFAQRTDLGWGIVGVVDHGCGFENDCDQIGVSHKVVVCEVGSSLLADERGQVEQVAFALPSKVKEVFSPTDIVNMMNLDFSEREQDGMGLSLEDRRFLEIVGKGVRRTEGHYEMPLPLKTDTLCLPHNKSLAAHRLNHLRNRLKGDETFRDHYRTFMNDMVEKGYAERVPADSLDRKDGRVFYIPHHGVYNPNKPGKIRVVFDCSAQFKGESLNKHLLQGPDLTNTLVGVLCRFRKDRVAVLCDIEQMFYQFRVSPNDRDLLRFLWWDNDDLDSDPVDFRMCVHLFGASSSPGCANFALKQIATDYENDFSPDVANFVRRDFYVDDGLTSKPTEKQAMNLIVQTKSMLNKGGLRLHKFLSSSKALLQQLPPEDLAKSFMEIDLLSDSLPIERALGVQWSIESDCFQFRITLSDKPLTRRGILSTINSVYDPLGFISPVILVGKQILQLLCADQLDWDSPISESLRARWECWRAELPKLASIEIDRSFKPDGFGQVVTTEVHHFSDASQCGYGQCSYLRLVDEHSNVHCSLIMGKSRVAPLKPVTIPRLELTAAVVSVKIGSLVERELDLQNVQSCYWTDSKVVLGYLNNEARRFHIFVANRVQQIHERTNTSQWRYIETSENPADIASRGASAGDLAIGRNWFSGPKFLWNAELPNKAELSEVSADDCELKKVHSHSTQSDHVHQSDLCSNFEYFSSWTRLRKAVALCLKYIRILKVRVADKKHESKCQTKVTKSNKVAKYPILSVGDLAEAEVAIIRVVQVKYFSPEIGILKGAAKPQTGSKKSLPIRKSALSGLDPFLDSEDIIHVGGRLKRSHLDPGEKNPVILPRKGHITDIVVRHFHERVNHQGRGMTINEIRANGLWIIGLSSAVYRIVSKCVICRRFRSAPRGQKMADLPVDRLESVPPFTYTGVDYFGPWLIREGRKEMKRYGVIFTCLCCRAIHLEIAAFLSTDSFLNALRRFMSIRGPVRELRSDRGTNFVGAEHELASAIAELDEQRISQFLIGQGCDNLLFKMNPPHASHMGGVWERQIRSVRNVLSLLLHQHGSQLNDESLRTLMCEAAAIVNSRPLTTQNLSDPLSLNPLTPNHLLTMKSKVLLPPPGNFQRTDLYSRKYWRRVQYLANQFWERWRKEYLQNLQIRKKWSRPIRNHKVGDIVLVIDENLPRCQWQLARIIEAEADQDDLVRKVKVEIATCSLDSRGRRQESVSVLERPIHKLVLVCETEETPVEEP